MHKAVLIQFYFDCIIVMQITFLPRVAALLVLSTSWIYYFQKDEEMDHEDTNSLFQHLEKEKEWEKLLTSLMEQEENLTEKLKPQRKKNPKKPSLKDEHFFKSELTAVSGSMPLDTIFILLLIHTCGAHLVASSISSGSHHMSPGGVLVELVGFTLAIYAMYKWKRKKSNLKKRIAQLEKESLKQEEDHDDVVTTLMRMKTELENQKLRLKELLEEVEGKREVNKKKLQAVEKEITQREASEKPEDLLKEKEDLLLAQWKLNETIKDNERQLLNTERLLEPIDIQVTRIRRKKEVDLG